MILIKGMASFGAAMLIGLSAPSAQAGYVVDLTQEGSDVVASGSGAIDLSGLTFVRRCTFSIRLNSRVNWGCSDRAGLARSTCIQALLDQRTFGSGPETFAELAGSGDLVGIVRLGRSLVVPIGYVSDSPLSDTATYDSQTFSSLGATPGTYKWTWGSGANQNFTLVIGAVRSRNPRPGR